MAETAELAELHQQILVRYGTLHAFCRAHPELNRSTVYMVFAGTYPGNSTRQARRIWAELVQKDPVNGVYRTLKEIACTACTRRKRKRCHTCCTLLRRQAEAVAARQCREKSGEYYGEYMGI